MAGKKTGPHSKQIYQFKPFHLLEINTQSESNYRKTRNGHKRNKTYLS